MSFPRLIFGLTSFAILILVIASSCSTRPKYVLSEKKMVEVFEDLYIAEAILKERKADFEQEELKKALMEGVLKKHKITQAELDSSLVWYADNINLYSQIQDTVSSQLQKRKEKFDEKSKKLYTYQSAGFTTDLPNHYTLDANSPTFRFRIDSNSIGSFDTERFKFSFSTRGIDTIVHRINAKVYFKYKDTTVVEQRRLLADKHYEFLKPALGDSLLQEIYGYIHISRATGKTPKVILENISNKSVDTIQNDSIK